jgi:Ca2+-binding EF-hand superfamily protein
MRNTRLAAALLLGSLFVAAFAATSLGQLPPWFKRLDTNGDGKIDRQEWVQGGKQLEDFRKLDRNGDGIITPDEARRQDDHMPVELKLVNGRAKVAGTLEMADEPLRGKKAYQVFTLTLQKGQTCRFDLASQLFQAYLFIENADGDVVAESGSDYAGGNTRVDFHPEKAGTYRVVATSLAGVRTGDFVLVVRAIEVLIGGLPAWFHELDADGDGQITLQEWLQGGKKLAEFRKWDRNDDGLITADEVLYYLSQPVALKLKNGAATYTGKLEPRAEPYHGKKSHQAFTVRLEGGENYVLELRSGAFQGHLYVESPTGQVLTDGGGKEGTAQLAFSPVLSGTYRVVAARTGGERTGDYVMSVRRAKGPPLPKGLPAWFKELDKDGDGMLNLAEWRQGGKSIEEFRKYDHNDDGLVTPEEVLRFVKRPAELVFDDGVAAFTGKLEDHGDEPYRGRKAYLLLTVKLEAGEDYRFELASQAFRGYLALETAEGKTLVEASGSNGGAAQLQFRADKGGTYRLVASSTNGNHPGDFELLARHLTARVPPPRLPAWFKELDTDGDGQLSLQEWLKGGKTLEEFRRYDFNDDGLVTAEEVLRQQRLASPAKTDAPRR